MNTKKNIGVMVSIEDKSLIDAAADLQRRSTASFLVESAVIRANQIFKDSKNEARTNDQG